MFTLWNLLCIEKLGIIFDLGATYSYAKLSRVIYSFNQFHMFAVIITMWRRSDFCWGQTNIVLCVGMVGLIVNTDSLVGIQTALSLPDFCHTMASFFPRGHLPFKDRIKRSLLLHQSKIQDLIWGKDLTLHLLFSSVRGMWRRRTWALVKKDPRVLLRPNWPSEITFISTESHQPQYWLCSRHWIRF